MALHTVTPARSAAAPTARGARSERGAGRRAFTDSHGPEPRRAARGSGGGRGRTSRYEPIAQKWSELDEDESIVLSDLEKNDIQNLRNLLYRRFGKENVIVRSAKQEDDTFKAVVRARDGDEYLRQD